jgi:acyl-CoA oxidase
MPGVIIGDCGPKLGFQTIDNGFIGFRNYRIEKESLLDRFSQVSDTGEFQSIFQTSDERFATVLGALEEGRLGIVGSAQVITNLNKKF